MSSARHNLKELGDDLTNDQKVEFSHLHDKFEVRNERESAQRKLESMHKLESLKPIDPKTEATPDIATSME